MIQSGLSAPTPELSRNKGPPVRTCKAGDPSESVEAPRSPLVAASRQRRGSSMVEGQFECSEVWFGFEAVRAGRPCFRLVLCLLNLALRSLLPARRWQKPIICLFSYSFLHLMVLHPSESHSPQTKDVKHDTLTRLTDIAASDVKVTPTCSPRPT